jgi:MFS family permease
MLVFLVLSPFILLEMITGFNLPKTLADLVMNTGIAEKPKRLGLFRAQGPLEHPILLGLVASLGFAPAYYMFGKLRGGFMFLMMFASLSSGPLLGAVFQLFLIAWDRVFDFLAGVKWMLLVYLLVLGGFALALASQFDLLQFVIKNLTYDPRTASGRMVNMIWGTREMFEHPIFGVGVGGYDRPWWLLHETSFDNFWLNYGMRYGIPALVLLLAAVIFSMVRIATMTTLSPQESEYRKGYLFALAGVCLVLGTVFVWNASSVFVMMYIGAGAWFYMQPRVTEGPAETATRARRAAQVRAFNVGPLVPAEHGRTGRVASGRSSR